MNTVPDRDRRQILSAALAAGGLAAGGSLLSIGARAAGKTKIDMQLGWLIGGNQLGEVVAKKQGYFEQEGIEFGIQPGGPSIDGVAVVASAVVTCVPGAMLMPASQMPSCTPDQQLCVSSGVAMDCCTNPEPSLTTAKADLLKAPVRHVLPWLTSTASVVIVTTALSIVSTESPPELTTAVGLPTYIILSTLRI